MMNIGEFASCTGLSVKALRHYDDRAVLRPDSVDPFTGYRRYGPGQVRTGITLKALREAGVPVATAAESAHSPEAARAALLAHRAAVLAAREAEDRAYARAETVLRGLARPVKVSEREKSAQPYVGVVVPGAVTATEGVDGDGLEEQLNTATIAVMEALASERVTLTGPSWLTMRSTGRDSIELVNCLPVDRRLPATWPSRIAVGELPDPFTVVVGLLPARREVGAALVDTEPGAATAGEAGAGGGTGNPTASGDSGVDDLPEGVLHPAAVALFDAVASHHAEADQRGFGEIRQTAAHTPDGDWRIELALTVESR